MSDYQERRRRRGPITEQATGWPLEVRYDEDVWAPGEARRLEKDIELIGRRCGGRLIDGGEGLVRMEFDTLAARTTAMNQLSHINDHMPGAVRFFAPGGGPQSNPAGEIAVPSNAVGKFRDFWKHDPTKVHVASGSFRVPEEAVYVGDAIHVLYRSAKHDPVTYEPVRKPIDYIHEHGKGVKVYRPPGPGVPSGPLVRMPAKVTSINAGAGASKTTSLVLLGECNGLEYDDGEQTYEMIGAAPLPELYCIPSGRALLVIQSRRTVKAIIFGGRLGGEPRGIVY